MTKISVAVAIILGLAFSTFAAQQGGGPGRHRDPYQNGK